MVAVASPAPGPATRTRRSGWSVGAVAVVVLGLGLRLVLSGGGVGDRSALVMGALLSVGAWLAARLLAGPGTALLAVLAAVLLLDLAALPQRDPPPYDDLEAFFTTDQVLSTQLARPQNLDLAVEALNVLVQPVFSGAQPRFGLAGTVSDTPIQWNCPFSHGIQWIALPVSFAGPQADVRLHLTGAPSRDGDYLIVYASARLDGFLLSLGPPDPAATQCRAA